jgi:hypothetical protein
MAFRYVHIRPNLPLAIRAVEGVRSTLIRSPPMTSLARRSGLARRARAISWECMPRASKGFKGFLCQFECAWPDRSVIFELPDLLRMESSGSKARRPPGRRLDVAEGGLARAARSKREAETESQFGRNYHGPRGCTGGAGAPGGPKEIPPNWPWM